MKNSRWSGVEKGELLQRIGILLENGYSLSAGIELLTFSQSKEIKQKLQEILVLLRKGTPFYEALELLNYPKDILSFLYFSEQYGELANGLKEAGYMYKGREKMKDRLRKLIRYPILLCWVLVIASIVMVHYLFPHFQLLFETMSMELPLPTVLFLKIISFFPVIILIVALLLLIGYLLYISKIRRMTAHQKVYYLLHIPFISSYVTSLITYYFSLQLSGLLKGGISILQALTIFSQQNHLLFFQEEARFIIKMLQQGNSLPSVVKSRKHYKEEFSLVIQHGEEQGYLEKELFLYSELIFEALQSQTKRLVMIVQPLMFVFIGVIVLFMFLSILLPMFQVIGGME